MDQQEVQYIAVPPNNVMAVLDQFSTSLEGVDKFARLVIAEVEEGRVDPLRVALYMKTMEAICERVRKATSEHALKEAAKYGQKSFGFLGAEVTIRDTYTRYDYSVCGHPAYNDLAKIKAETERQMKDIEATLKTLKGPQEMLFDGGEVATVKPPRVERKEGIAISIK